MYRLPPSSPGRSVREQGYAQCASLYLGDDDPSHPRDGRTRQVSGQDALVGLLPSTHPRDLSDTIVLPHGGVEVSSLSSYVGQLVVRIPRIPDIPRSLVLITMRHSALWLDSSL